MRPDPYDPHTGPPAAASTGPSDVDAPVRPEPLGAAIPRPDPSAPTRVAIGPGDLDTDVDGVADSVVLADGADLVLHTDLDGDGLADQVLRPGPATLPPRTPPPTVDPLARSPADVRWWAPWTWFADP
ncbi:hypothetical protein GCM10023215_24280 [Pseudonocardia yuanmonensis]|uniref:Uncharacterized protein n=1 Tax=Pseudonocardia yuanmonensis TaxID=1095914 RepID=A0ABP8WGA4_9PSEU